MEVEWKWVKYSGKDFRVDGTRIGVGEVQWKRTFRVDGTRVEVECCGTILVNDLIQLGFARLRTNASSNPDNRMRWQVFLEDGRGCA